MVYSYDKIIDIIYDINTQIYEVNQDDYLSFYLTFETDGFAYNIVIGEACLYSSEDSFIEYNSKEEFYAKLKQHLIIEINKLINSISNINNIKL